MVDAVYAVKISLDRVIIHDDTDVFGAGEIYLIGNIGGRSTGRSPVHSVNDGDSITLGGAAWTHELQVSGLASIAVRVDAWDVDSFGDESLGAVSTTVDPPWNLGNFTTRAPSGKFSLVWSVGNVIAVPAVPGVSFVARNFDGSSFVSTLVLPTVVPMVRYVEIRGLNAPGVDDRAVKPPGTTKNSGFQAGYSSLDDKGRIFTNRSPAGVWAKDQQYIDVTVEVLALPMGAVLPPGTKVKWSFIDPDDPTNEPPNIQPAAGRLIDPNDFSGAAKTGARPGDNNPRGKATATARFDTADPAFPFAGGETPVTGGQSKVRFHVSDVAGDNFILRAEPVHPSFLVTIAGQTGIMTVWHRIEIEYVKMATSAELPVDQIAKHYEITCAQIDVSEKREVSGAADKVRMGATDATAYTACDAYCTSAGQFTHEGQGGWFFMVAGRRFLPAAAATILYEGPAEARDDVVRLPAAAPGVPAVVRVFDATKIVGLVAPLPNDRSKHIKFRVDSRAGRDITIVPHDFHAVNNPDTSFLDAHLGTYGIGLGSSIYVQVLSAGDDALVTAGISPGGKTVAGRHYFGGKLMVFTETSSGPDVLGTLCHELCHAFDNAHKCGNWDWERKGSTTSCCMNYWFQFVLNDGTPRRPVAWTQDRQSPNMCGPHVVSIRDYHLEDNPGLGW